MKLPQILAQSVPQGQPRSSGYGDAAAAPYVAAAAGIERVGATVSKGLAAYADVVQKREDAIRKEEIAGEIANAEATLETRVAEIESSVRTSVTDHDQVVPAWRKLVDEASAVALTGVRDPAAAAALRRKLPAILQKSYAGMLKRRDDLRTDEMEANAEDTIDRQRGLARNDALTDDEAVLGRIEKIYNALTPMRALKGGTWVFKRAQSERDQLLTERLKRLSDEAPETLAREIETNPLYRELPVTVKQEAVKHAATVQRQRHVEMDKYLDQVEKEAEIERQGQLASLSDLASQRLLTPAKVREARSLGIIENGREFEHYMTLATKPVTDTPSDPVIWNDVSGDVWGATPTYNETKIRALMTRHSNGGPGLNAENGRMALSELARKRQDREATQKSDQQREYERDKDSYARAKDEGLMQLGITTPLSQLDGPAAALATAFVRDLNARVLDARGNVVRPARQTMYEILPRYLEQQSADAKLNYQKLSGVAGATFKTTVPEALSPDWMGWYMRQQGAIEAIKTTNPNLYAIQRDALMELKRRRDETVRAETLRTESPRPGNYQPPAAVRP